MSRRTYSRQFKIEAVRLVTEEGLSKKQAARDLGVDPASIRLWIKQYAQDPAGAFPGKGHRRDEELHQLRRELKQLRMERDILKKAIGIFSQMPPK
ncbi:MAG: transposase [Rhodothermaceae bacterium]|nr:MAG: transposase [Rhodothermaceae bacterium]